MRQEKYSSQSEHRGTFKSNRVYSNRSCHSYGVPHLLIILQCHHSLPVVVPEVASRHYRRDCIHRKPLVETAALRRSADRSNRCLRRTQVVHWSHIVAVATRNTAVADMAPVGCDPVEFYQAPNAYRDTAGSPFFVVCER